MGLFIDNILIIILKIVSKIILIIMSTVILLHKFTGMSSLSLGIYLSNIL